MQPARQYVSKVRSMLKLNSIDFLISDRTILKELLQVNVKLVTQQLNKRSGTNYSELYTPISCLEMEKIPLYTCCTTESDCIVTRTKQELPAIVDTYNGLAINFIGSLDGRVKFDYLDNPQRLANILKIYPNKKLGTYYWVYDNRIYTTSPDLETITARIFFKELFDPNTISCSGTKECVMNPLDLVFRSLPKLEEDITTITANNIASTFLRIRQENTSDQMEGN